MRRQQQGSLERNGGAWHCRYRDTIRDDSGELKRVLRSHRLCDGKMRRADALEMMREYVRTRVNLGVNVVEASSTVVHFIEHEYLPDRDNNCSPSTSHGYRELYKAHGPALDQNMRLRDFTTYDGQQLMRLIAKRAHLSRNTLKHIKSFFSGVFTHALRLGFIDSGNPMRYVEIPRESAPTVDTYAYGPEEIEAMLKVLPEPANTLIMLAAHTGLRHSEIRGLIWAAWQGDTISVTQSVWRKHVKDTKSKASRAPIPVSRELEARLTQFKPPDALPTDPIFIGARGKEPLNLANVVRRVVLPALANCASCGLAKDKHAALTHPFIPLPQWHGFHSFRRAIGTFLHHKRVDDKTIQALLRHSNVAVTQACYIKTVSQDVRDAMDKVDGAFSGKLALVPRKESA